MSGVCAAVSSHTGTRLFKNNTVQILGLVRFILLSIINNCINKENGSK